MSQDPAQAPAGAPADQEEVLLTRQQASVYLETFAIRLKPASLARLWSVGGRGPPCLHIRGKPYYPQDELRIWARSQRSGLRRSARDPRPPETTRCSCHRP